MGLGATRTAGSMEQDDDRRVPRNIAASHAQGSSIFLFSLRPP
jgi:hypothetical protein